MFTRDSPPSTWAKFWKRDRSLHETYPSSPSVRRTLVEHFALDGLEVLEVGTGSGRDSLELARRGARVTVLDFTTESLQLVRQQETPVPQRAVRALQANALHMPCAPQSFDLVFHQGLLEHFREPERLLAENHRVLRPGGYLLCDVPQTFHPYTVLKHILIASGSWFAGWETQYTIHGLERLVAHAGFETVHRYGDWMRPSLAYRITRELGRKIGLRLPRFPWQGTRYQRTWDRALDRLSRLPLAQYTQVSIGVLARKVDRASSSLPGHTPSPMAR